MEPISYKDPKVIIKETKEDTSALNNAAEVLQKAVRQVATAAEVLSKNASGHVILSGDYLVDTEDMDNLRLALDTWRKASVAALQQL